MASLDLEEQAAGDKDDCDDELDGDLGGDDDELDCDDEYEDVRMIKIDLFFQGTATVSSKGTMVEEDILEGITITMVDTMA